MPPSAFGKSFNPTALLSLLALRDMSIGIAILKPVSAACYACHASTYTVENNEYRDCALIKYTSFFFESKMYNAEAMQPATLSSLSRT